MHAHSSGWIAPFFSLPLFLWSLLLHFRVVLRYALEVLCYVSKFHVRWILIAIKLIPNALSALSAIVEMVLNLLHGDAFPRTREMRIV